MAATLRIVHTSDWHLGCMLYGHKRYEECAFFLNWLAQWCADNAIDVLLIAGDIFDTMTPSNRAQELYYAFLCSLRNGPVRHVVITAGNHDSPSFLQAPKDLLRLLNIHVIASVTDCVDEEICVLSGPDGKPELLICAVPYLRDRDIRTSEAGESSAEKVQKQQEGICRHYASVLARAHALRGEADIPLLAMGHLFAEGGQTVEGDGVRELAVGTLERVSASCFSADFAYVALGHLHVPQMVGGNPRIRYSGSPIPIGFGEAGQEKSLCVITLTGQESTVELVPIPRWQELVPIAGSMEDIEARICELKAADSHAWLEITYTGSSMCADLHERVDALVADSGLLPLRVKNTQSINRYLHAQAEERLDELTVNDVFLRCLDEHKVDPLDRPRLLITYQEALTALAERENAE